MAADRSEFKSISKSLELVDLWTDQQKMMKTDEFVKRNYSQI
jgi:hypothetical protein